MPTHKYSAGDRVIAITDPMNANVPAGIYTIIKALPLAGRGCQYRGRNALESHERVLDEGLLRPANT